MPKHDREGRRLQVSTVYPLTGVLVAHPFVPSHMTCKKCKYEFCWVCMGAELRYWCFSVVADCTLCLYLGPWSEHGTAWYSCNRFDEKESVDARDAQSKSRASLERYLHVSGARFSDLRIPQARFLICSSTVLQPMGKPRTISQAVDGLVRQD